MALCQLCRVTVSVLLLSGLSDNLTCLAVRPHLCTLTFGPYSGERPVMVLSSPLCYNCVESHAFEEEDEKEEDDDDSDELPPKIEETVKLTRRENKQQKKIVVSVLREPVKQEQADWESSSEDDEALLWCSMGVFVTTVSFKYSLIGGKCHSCCSERCDGKGTLWRRFSC